VRGGRRSAQRFTDSAGRGRTSWGLAERTAVGRSSRGGRCGLGSARNRARTFGSRRSRQRTLCGCSGLFGRRLDILLVSDRSVGACNGALAARQDGRVDGSSRRCHVSVNLGRSGRRGRDGFFRGSHYGMLVGLRPYLEGSLLALRETRVAINLWESMQDYQCRTD
jgi:hypothetical protein